MFARITGAAVRAILVALVVAIPALLLPEETNRSVEMVALLALLAAALTFVEYSSEFPSIIEFRDSPPLNRFRFLSLAAMVLVMTMICKHAYDPTNATALFAGTAGLIASWVDFPFSPVHLVTLMLPPDTSIQTLAAVRMTAAVSYVISLITVAAFLFVVRILCWPICQRAFNVWVNLPLFDPTAGGDVLYRMQRDGRINIIAGVLLPFVIPALVKVATDWITPISMENPQTLIWVVAAWAFLPASMIMRGVAMLRIASLIEEKRRRAYADNQAMQAA